MTEALRNGLLAAFARRQSLGLAAETDAYRLFHGYGEEPALRLTIDRLGAGALIRSREEPAGVEAACQALRESFGDELTIIHKDVSSGSSPEAQRGLLLSGTCPEPWLVTEDGAELELELLSGRNTGLFLDGRALRRLVRREAEGRRVLNLFSYTACFGVAALRGGARWVINVDRKKSFHAWGQRNYRRNGLRVDPRDFLRRDVGKALRELSKGKRRFDMIILDPPRAFRRGRGGAGFHAVEDYGGLLRRCLPFLDSGGLLLAVVTELRLLETALSELALESAAAAGVELAKITPLPRDDDFPSDGREPGGKGLLLELT